LLFRLRFIREILKRFFTELALQQAKGFNMDILSIITDISRYGGAQKVMLDLHNGLKNEFHCKILSLQPYNKLHPKYGITEDEFLRFVNPMQLKNKILIVHARNLLPFLILLKRIFFLNTRIIYVSHSIYDNLKNLTLFPREIVSVSNNVSENLINYFGVNPSHISRIYNGLKDFWQEGLYHYKKDGIIKILYPARINKGKNQLDIVKVLKGYLADNIVIFFAGIGEDFDELVKICDNKQFIALGFVSDVHSVIEQCDYLMLYSAQEGLPLSLIEGIMHGKPILTNNIGGSLEIGIPEYNGILLSDNIISLIEQVNSLNNISKEDYEYMATNSRKLYLQRFRYEQMIREYKRLINKESV